MILGMHRSGTSALAGVLHLLGVDLGSRLIEGAADNPKGYWEHADAVRIHETLLHALGSSWEDVRELPSGWIDFPAADAAAAAIEVLIREEFADKPMWGVKDPRLCRFVPLWLRVLGKLGIRPAIVLIARNPEEVAASLGARDGIAAEYARLLWLEHLVEGERATRDQSRALLTYDNLLLQPARALVRLAQELDLAWPVDPQACEDELASFLDLGQRHHHFSAPSLSAGADSTATGAVALFALIGSANTGEGAWGAIAGQSATLKRRLALAEPWVGSLVATLGRARERHVVTEERLRATDSILGSVNQLSLDRLVENEALGAQLGETQRALEHLQVVAVERLEQSRLLDKQLTETQQALEQLQVMSIERLEQSRLLDKQLTETQQALELLQVVAVERLEQSRLLDKQLAATQMALEQAQALALERLEQMGQLDKQLFETDSALESIKQVALDRSATIESLESLLRVAEASWCRRATKALRAATRRWKAPASNRDS